MRLYSTKDLTQTSLMVALMIVVSQISIPMPYGVPLTFQTLIIPIVGLILGKKKGTLAVCLYLFLGFIGLPVFANFSGGISVFFGPTAGFILSFPLMAYTAGLGQESQSKMGLYLGLLLGAVLNYVTGFIFYHLITSVSLSVAFSATVLPFIPSACLKIILIVLIYSKLSKAVPQNKYN